MGGIDNICTGLEICIDKHKVEGVEARNYLLFTLSIIFYTLQK